MRLAALYPRSSPTVSRFDIRIIPGIFVYLVITDGPGKLHGIR